MSTDSPSPFIQSGRDILNAQRQREIQAMRDARETKLRAESDRKAHDVAQKLQQPKAQLKPFDAAALIAISAVKARQAWIKLAIFIRIRIVALDRLLRAATAIVRNVVPALVQAAPRPMLMLAAPAQPVALLPATVQSVAVFGWQAGASAQVAWDKQIGWDAIKATARKYAQDTANA